MSRSVESVSIGSCGEYFVSAELERRGFTVAVPMANTINFDLLAVCRETNRQTALQVKTTSFGALKWIISNKDKVIKDKNVYYIFVHLHELDEPEFFIIPSEEIYRIANNSNSKVITFSIKDEFVKYKNNWQLLK